MQNETLKQAPLVAPGRELIIDRTFHHRAKLVWRAWTEPAIFKKWWGPANFKCPFAEMDVRVGGRYLNCMLSEKGEEFWSTGVYQEIIRYKKLRFTDSFSDDKGNVVPATTYNMPGSWPEQLTVTVTFNDIGSQTKMQMVQLPVPPESYDACVKGWHESFDKLDALIVT